MGVTGRRRLDRVLIAGAAVLAGASAAIGALVGDTERIAAYWVHAELSASDEATVVEVIDYDFGPHSRRGILRNIPGVDPEAPILASSPTAPDDLQVTPGFTEVRLRIGDPGITIRNRHRYRIQYPIEGLVVGDRVAWDAVGTGFDVPISQAEIHLTAPVELEALRCDRGRTGDIGGCTLAEIAPGHVVASVRDLDPGEGVTVTATTAGPVAAPAEPPAEPAGPAPDPGTGWLTPALLAAIAALVAAPVVSVAFRQLGRERVWQGGAADAAFGPPPGSVAGESLLDHGDLADLATIEFEAPRDLSAAAGGIIHAESVRNRHKVAWLIEAAIRGEVELEEEDDDLALRRGDAAPHSIVAPTLDVMFAGRDRIELGKYDKAFAAGWNRLGVELEMWRRNSGLWDPAGRTRRTTARVLGVVAALVGCGAAAVGAGFANRSGDGWLPVVVVGGALVGIGLGALIRSWELLVRTPEGSARWLQTESFRRFIEASEARHAEAAAEMGLLRQYTAWAVALDQLGRWERAIDDAAEVPGSTVGGRVSTDLAFVGLSSSLSSATTQTATAPSSSGGGGGGVGGGGGGGGGGSW